MILFNTRASGTKYAFQTFIEESFYGSFFAESTEMLVKETEIQWFNHRIFRFFCM
jgi:hypothetical protein